MATLALSMVYSAIVSYAMSAIIRAMTPNATAVGPRLTDVKSSGSAYGVAVPIGYGTVRTAGNIIWAANIKEVATTETQGGGKAGGGGTDVTTYSYFGSFAVAFGAGPAKCIRRIWWDTKLVYDVTGSALVTYKGAKLRLYLGDETQLPDSLIVNGTGQTPADGTGDLTPGYRGLVYVVFDNCPLADFGNRIPQVSAEIAWESTDQTVRIDPTFLPGTSGHGMRLVDFAHGVYLSSTSDGLSIFLLDSNTEVLQRRWVDILPAVYGGVRGMVFGTNGILYGSVNEGIVEIDPATLTMKRYLAGDIWSTWFDYAVPVHAQSANMDFLVYANIVHSVMNSVSVVNLSGNLMSRCDVQILSFGQASVCAGALNNVWLVSSGTDSNAFAPGIEIIRAYLGGAGKLQMGDRGVVQASDIDATWTTCMVNHLTYDATDNTLLVGASGGNGEYTFKYQHGVGIVWKVPIQAWGSQVAARLTAGTYAFPFGTPGLGWGWIAFLDTIKGTYTTKNIASVYAQIPDPPYAYDGERDALLTVESGKDGNILLLLRRGSADTVTVGSIVGDICRRVGLQPGDYDTSLLTAPVRGYLLNNPTPARANIDPLSLAFMFDGAESDYRIKFIPRGTVPGTDVAADDLIVQDSKSGNIVTETRAQESELASKVTLTYLDQDNAYQEGSQYARRITLPVPTTGSANEMTQTVPLVFSATEAKQIAEKILYAIWVERMQQDVKVGQKYLANDCLDVITVTLPDGTEFVSRILSFDVGADYSLEAKLIADDPTIYVSTVNADGGVNYPQTLPSGLSVSLPTRLFLIDAPSLIDSSIPVGPTSNLLWASSAVLPGAFAGASLQRSNDGSFYTAAGTTGTGAAWGAARNALGDVANPWTWDTVNTLNVFVPYGSGLLASVTDLAVLNGANPALILDDNGTVELIQYQSAVLNADRAFTLSRLLRGRRGTDTMTGGHAAGAIVVFPTVAAVQALSLAFGDLGSVRWYRSVGNRTVAADAPVIAFTSIGRDLMPYAPVHLKAVKSGADIVLSWVRRTRYGGELMDGTGEVPLGETTEAYSVDVFKAGTVVRTLASVVPSVTYLAAQVAADFGAMPATLDLEAFQLSSVIGRGFGQQTTVGVQ